MEQKQSAQISGRSETDFQDFCETGAPEAMGRVFDALAPGLLLMAGHLGADAHGAEDFVQQTFLAALERKEHWDPSRPLFPWFAGILTHKVRHGQRQEAKRQGRSLEGETWVDSAFAPADVAAAVEVHQRVAAAIDALGAPYRKLLVLHLIHGLKAHEIAHAMGDSPGTVRMQLKRGKEQLRSQLPAEFHGALAAVSATAVGIEHLRANVLRQSNATVGISGAALPSSALLGVVATIVAAALSGVVWAWPTHFVQPPVSRVSTAGELVGAELTMVPVEPAAAHVALRLAVQDPLSPATIRVIRGDGSAVRGATVWREPLATAEQTTWQPTRLGITGVNGELESNTTLEVGHWRLWATTDAGERTWTTETQGRHRGETQPTTPVVLTLPSIKAGLWLRGRVVNAVTHEPLKSVRLALECEGAFAPAWSGSDGRFRIGPIPPETELGAATGPLLVARRTDLGVRMAPWRRLEGSITAMPDDGAKWPPLYMDAALEVHGNVVFQEGTPVPHATVKYPYQGGRLGAALIVRSNEAGRFKMKLPTGDGNVLIEAHYPGFQDCGVRTPDSKTLEASPTLELRFAEDPGPKLVIHGFENGAPKEAVCDGPFRVSLFREGLYFSAPLWRGATYLPPADTLPSGSWGRASITLEGASWFPIAEVKRAVIEDTGTTKLTPTWFQTGSLVVQSAEPKERFDAGHLDTLFLELIPPADSGPDDDWPTRPPFGANLPNPTTRLDHLPVGTYRAEDSAGRASLIEVREGQVTHVSFSND